MLPIDLARFGFPIPVGREVRLSRRIQFLEVGMYAVVDIAGSQYKVREGENIRVARLDAEVGSSRLLSDVLLVGGGDEIQVGTPQVEGATVEARVKGHGLADKITVFKMKRRKNYRRKRGHRQAYTELQIEKIKA